MSTPKKWHGSRTMLNGPGYHSTAAIVAEVQDTEDVEIDKDMEEWSLRPWTTLQISDCTRTISLDFSWETEKDRKNDLAKIDALLSTLTEFRSGVVIEQQRYVKRLTEIKKREDKKT